MFNFALIYRFRERGRPNTKEPVIEVRENPEGSETGNIQHSEYEMTGDQNREMDTDTSPEFIELTTDNNQYEKPKVYVNMMERRNEYESLNE